MKHSENFRLLVVGGNGQLGKALVRSGVGAGSDLFALAKHELDITDEQAVRRVVRKYVPTHIINAAAYTLVDKAEQEKELAFAVNCNGARNLAEAAYLSGSRLLHVSTDFVFDGCKIKAYEPSDETNPINIYGESKLAGEKAITQVLGESALILRTSWIYSLDSANFLTTMLRLMAQRKKIQVVDDQIGTPTSSDSVANVLISAVQKDFFGIHHWADGGYTSRYGFALQIAKEAFDQGMIDQLPKIEPVTSLDFCSEARRPVNSRLDTASTVMSLNCSQNNWTEMLRSELSAGRARRARAHASL